MLVGAFFWVCIVHVCQSSVGDRNEDFRRCLLHCSFDGCTQLGKLQSCDTLCFNEKNQSTILKITQWNCRSDCEYACMHLHNNWRWAKGYQNTLKYYGKWPFQRVLGCQEIFSVIFSIGNLLAHLLNIIQLKKWVHKSNSTQLFKVVYPFVWVWWLNGLVQMNSWIWSSVFHCRDLKFTERMDYISADVSITFLLIVSFLRIAHRLRFVFKCVGIVSLLWGLGYHIYYMLFIEFDYGLNVKISVCLGILQSLLWLLWVHFVSHPGRQTMYYFLFLINVSMLLEVLDFPPLLGYVDAHAAWHLVTIPLILLFYRFVYQDIQWTVQKEKSV